MSARDRMLIRGDDEWTATVDEILAEHREEVLEEIEDKIREASAGHAGTGLCPQISTARGAADLVARMRN